MKEHVFNNKTYLIEEVNAKLELHERDFHRTEVHTEINGKLYEVASIYLNVLIPVEKVDFDDESWGNEDDDVNSHLTVLYDVAKNVNDDDLIKKSTAIVEFLEYASVHCHDTFERDGIVYANKSLCISARLDPDSVYETYFRKPQREM